MKPTKLLLIGLAFVAGAAQAQNNMTPADNSAINERDRKDATLTPEDQSQSKTDIELAAKVRRAVVSQSGISMDGQNIKIITMNNTVTLRGPVKDAAERTAIDETARSAAGKATIVNELEIK